MNVPDSRGLEDRLIADDRSRWWDSAEGLACRRRIETEVRARYEARLARAGWLPRLWLEHRIRREVAAECTKILWLGS